MIKRFVFLFIVFAAVSALAQTTFLFIPDSVYKIRSLGNEIVFNVPIHNISSQTITVSVIRRSNILPDSLQWQSSMCFDECFAPDQDSVSSTAIEAGQTREFSLHVFATGVEGFATVTLTALNNRTPSDSITLGFLAATYPVSVEKSMEKNSFTLEQNYPNPFNPSTKIRYSVAAKSAVDISVYSVLGQKIASLVSGISEPGMHEAVFDAAQYNLTSGTYLIRMQSEGMVKMQKALLVK